MNLKIKISVARWLAACATYKTFVLIYCDKHLIATCYIDVDDYFKKSLHPDVMRRMVISAEDVKDERFNMKVTRLQVERGD